MRFDFTSVSHSKLDHIGQIKLALCIAVVQSRQPSAQQTGGHGHDAAVNFLDASLLVRRVFVFHNGGDLLGSSAQNASIAAGRRGLQGQQSQMFGIAQLQQGLQGVGLYQGHIARQNQRDTIVIQHGNGLLHGVAGTELRHLPHTLKL